MTVLPYIDADEIARHMDILSAVEAIERALRDGFDPADDIPRMAVPLHRGEFLVMPAQVGDAVGIKVLTVAPGNADVGLPRIQGNYLLFDATTLAPTATLDGAALTTLRTPAVSIAAVRSALTASAEPIDIVVFGAGPQSRAHVAAVNAAIEGVRARGEVTFVVRSDPADPPSEARVVRVGTPAAEEALRSAGLVVCATSARTPLFDSKVLRDDVIVVAVGSHEPDTRELDSALMERAQVVVEEVSTALRECGDVVLAIADGALAPDDLIPMRKVVKGAHQWVAGRPIVFKSAGMSWEDVVIARAIEGAMRQRRPLSRSAHPSEG